MNAEYPMVIRTVSGKMIRIDVWNENVFRVRIQNSEDWVRSILERYGFIQQGEPTMKVYQMIATDQYTKVHTKQAALTIKHSSGELLFESSTGRFQLEQLTSSLQDERYPSSICFMLSPEERLYGLGDENRNMLMKRGHRTHMIASEHGARAPVPFLMSSCGWGVFLNTTSPHLFDIGSTDSNRLTISGQDDKLDLFLFAGQHMAHILELFTEVSGRPVLLPIWAYGLTFVCNQQADAREVLEDAMKFREEGIPCDVIGLEPGWMKPGDEGSIHKQWHPERFYVPQWSPKGQHTFIGALRNRGFKLSLWMTCYYDLSRYEEERIGGSIRISSGPSGEPGGDPVYGSEERWYQHWETFVDQGTAAFKLSAAYIRPNNSNRQWANGLTTESMCNLYPLLLAKQMHQGFVEQTSRRPMIYSEVGYMGLQQYSAMWTGGLAVQGADLPSLYAMLNLGLSGMTNLSADMDIHTAEGIHFGFLQPWAMVNSWAYWRHPCLLPHDLREIFKRYAKLRYRLLPYIYSAAYTAYCKGMPIMRAMPIVFHNDVQAWTYERQYMFGDALLVGAYTRTIYLPKGRWIDYWTGESHTGPKQLDYLTPEGTGGPLLVRAGSIIPMYSDAEYISEKPVEQISLHIYPEGTSAYSLYEDDGISLDYMKDGAFLTNIACSAQDGDIEITIEKRKGSCAGIPHLRSYEILVYTTAKPSWVKVNGMERQEHSAALLKKGTDGWTFHRKSGCLRLYLEEGISDQGRNRDSQTIHIHCSPHRKPANEARFQVITAAAIPQEQGAEHKLRQKGSHGADLDVIRVEDLLYQLENLHPSTVKAREQLLHLGGLLIHCAVSRGWSLHEILREEYASFLEATAASSVEESLHRLRSAAERLAQHARKQARPREHPLIEQTKALVEQELEHEITLRAAAERLHTNASHLSRLFKQSTSITFSQYVLERKMLHARKLLNQGCKVAVVGERLGYKDPGYFIRIFREYWGTTPGQWRE
ncbi:TIM-barrel domain-containing protein [Paenibacillus sp. 32352]|uniref:TIM-barrel domain-containing protein n=1 Tax=Paenibacillus sp. 32352 TaxID=1969111 RepID=UPI0009AE688C|nr:TIM-barrel domain-containing protein [Paenibacillus sp. 32352]